MKKILPFLALVILLEACSKKTEKTTSEIELMVDSIAHKWTVIEKVPSMAIGIVKDGKVVLAKGYGYANLEEKTLASENTIYQLGSITKMFTGRVLTHLAIDAQMSLGDTLENYFPGTDFPSGIEGKEITIKDVATHSGEFPIYPANLDRVDPHPIKGYTKNQMLAGIEMMVMDTTIGSQFYYSNFGYGVLANAMENLMKKDLATLIDSYILTPYEMKNTSLFLTENQRERLATPYLDVSPIVETGYWEMGALAGAGNMFSSVSDLNIFLLKLLADDTINRIQQNKHFKIPHHENWYYGLGCFIVDSEKWSTETVFHGSDQDGYAGNLRIYPEYNFGYVILTNWGEGDVLYNAISTLDQAIRDFIWS